MRKFSRRFLQLGAALAMAACPLSVGAGDLVTYAGTVIAVNGDRGSFVLQDVGPWRGASEAPIVNRTIVLTPSTRLTAATRAWDGGAKFPGDYEENPAPRSDLRTGAFVAVECEPTGAGCQAHKLTLIQTDRPS